LLKPSHLNSFLRLGEILSDGITDVDTLASSETAVADSIVNLFDGDPLLGLAQTGTPGVQSFMTGTSAGGAPSFTATAPVDTGPVVASGSSMATVIDAGATLELTSAYSGIVSFAGTTGTLKIDNSSSFSGEIAGPLAIGDVIDLADITAGANATIGYSGNNSPGTLTVSDGIHTASIALLGNYSLANFTASSDGHGGTSVIDPPLAGDGSANAPAGTPQLPNILSGYTERPSWMVAGVDYAVGIPQGTVLKDPATIAMAGVTVDKNLHQIIVTASNVTLNAYDFSLAGGWSVITQAANTTISNSNFQIGSNHNFTIYGDTGSSNLTVMNCVINGNMLSDSLNNGLIYTSTPGLSVCPKSS